LNLNVLRVEADQALQVVENGPVSDDGPVDRVLGEVDDATEARLHDLFPADSVDDLNAVGGLK
jgi:hypothetical protein